MTEPTETIGPNDLQLAFHTGITLAEQASAGDPRTFSALILPWGAVTVDYRKLTFNKGSVTWDTANLSRIKLLAVHDAGTLRTLIGVATAITSKADGIHATFRLATTADADYAWTLLSDGVLDGVSVGVSIDYTGIKYNEDDGSYVVTTGAVLKETSLVPIPAFADARVSAGAAVLAAFAALSSPATAGLSHNGGDSVTITTPEAVPPVTTELSFNGDALVEALKEGNATLGSSIADGILAGLRADREAEAALLASSTEGASAAPGGRASVTERHDYGFGAEGSTYSFTRDLAIQSKNGHIDSANAAQRIAKFQGQLNDGTVDFAQVRADVVALSPTTPRNDLYVDQLAYTTPLWDAVSTGTLTDITPFVLPKWVSASALSGDHVEGTNPTAGTVTLTTQTITPFAISGSYQASREAFEAGTPQLDTIVLRAMVLEYEQDREAKIAAALLAVTLTGAHAQVIDSSDNVIAGVTDGEVVGDKIAAVLIDQIFARGGTRIDRTTMGQTPYTALVAAKDADRRPMFPALGQVNADGSKSVGVKALNVHDEIIVPAPALPAANGYSFASESVWSWASPVRQFRFEERLGVANIELALFGYQANAILRDGDVYRYTVQA